MRAVVGLVLLVAVAFAGAGLMASPEQIATALQTSGLSRYLPQPSGLPKAGAEASTAEPQPQPAATSRYSPFRTVAVSEPTSETATVATGAAPSVSSSLVGRSEIAPPANPSQPVVAAPSGKASDAVADKKGRFKMACSAGQRLDRAHHKCVPLKHAAHSKKKNG